MPDLPDFDFPPCGFDRADGSQLDSLGTPIGTPTPDAARQIRRSQGTQVFEELPTSPEIERAEQCTVKHTFRGEYDQLREILKACNRGTFTKDSLGNYYRVLSAALSRLRGDMCQLDINSESISFDNPPDQFEVNDVEMNMPLELHPRYNSVRFYNLDENGEQEDPGFPTGYQLIQWIKNSVNQMQISAMDENLLMVGTLGVDPLLLDDPDWLVANLALEMVNKMRKGETEFYFSGLQVVWSQYFFMPPVMNPGGYLEDPVENGGLPPFFWSTDRTVDGDNILTFMGPTINPDLYADGFSWLRKADRLQYERTWYRLTHTWIGGPLGHWDSDIYPDIYSALPPLPP